MMFKGQEMKSQSIYHDLEKDFYYKIDKTTGIVHQVHKNGKTLKSFKVDVTGNDYKNRRKPLRQNKTLQQPQQSQSTKKWQKFPRLKRQRDMPISQNKLHASKNGLKVSINKQKKKNNDNLLLKNSRSEMHFVNSVISTEQNKIMRKNNKLESILQNYSQLKDKKIYQNHCLQNKQSGIVISQSLANKNGFKETKNQFSSSFSPENNIKKLKTSLGDYKKLQNKELRQTLARQLMKEKHQFLQSNPKFIQKQNQRMLDIQKQRKKNNKKLQQQFIKQNQKMTSEIYELYYE